MTLLWVSIVITALIAAAVALVRQATRHRPRYIESAAWTEEHWREQHDRAKVQQQRMTGTR